MHDCRDQGKGYIQGLCRVRVSVTAIVVKLKIENSAQNRACSFPFLPFLFRMQFEWIKFSLTGAFLLHCSVF
jgi:hypothetical protein